MTHFYIPPLLRNFGYDPPPFTREYPPPARPCDMTVHSLRRPFTFGLRCEPVSSGSGFSRSTALLFRISGSLSVTYPEAQ